MCAHPVHIHYDNSTYIYYTHVCTISIYKTMIMYIIYDNVYNI